MTPKFDPARQCDGKVRYESKAKAKRANRINSTKFGDRHGRMAAYRCPHCGWFHLGHMNPTIRDRQRDAS